MKLELSGRTALALGGTRGLGRACAVSLAAEGALKSFRLLARYRSSMSIISATIPGDQAFQPLEKSTCSLVKKP